MQGMDRMTVHPRLEAPKQGIALGVFESHQVRLDDAVDAVQIDVVLDAVGEDRGLQLDVFRGKIEAEVGLLTVFGPEIAIANLIAQRTFMLAV